MSPHLSPLKNISKNLRSMSHHLPPSKNNSQNSRTSPHATSLFSIEFFYENSSSMSHQLMPHHLSLLKIILKIQENHLMPHHLSLLKIFLKIQGACHLTFLHAKIILKIQRNNLISRHISPLKNKSKTIKNVL
jgi:hypothetical protein